MKRLLLVLILLSVFFMNGCLALMVGGSSLVMAEDGESSEEESLEYKENYTDYFNEITDNLSYESAEKLIEINKKYGIEIRFDQPSPDKFRFESDERALEVDEANFDDAIDYIYRSLLSFGDDLPTRKIIDDCIDTLYIYEDLLYQGELYSCSANTSDKVALVSISDFDYHGGPVDLYLIGLPLSTFISEQYGFLDQNNDYREEFTYRNRNGFIGYEQDVGEGIGFVAMLDAFIDDEARQTECLKAGFFFEIDTYDIQDDFASYFLGLFNNSFDFWDSFEEYYAINQKAYVVVDYLNNINPKWTFHYFVNKSHPSGESTISKLQDTTFDLSTEYIGLWQGYYENNSGEMQLSIAIEDIDPQTGELTGMVHFAPGDQNDKAKGGSYSITGWIDFESEYFEFFGDSWISEQPAGYEMLNMSGNKMLSFLVGHFDRDELTDFYVDKIE